MHRKKTENVENEDIFNLEEFINCGYQKDPLPSYILQLPVNRANSSKNLTPTDCVIVNGRLYYLDSFYVLIIVRYVFISVFYIMISLMEVIEELIILVNSCIITIIGQSCNALSENTFATVTNIKIAKALNSKTKEFLAFVRS